MEGYLTLLRLLSGLCFLPACFPQKYYVIDKPQPWSTALDYCRRHYTDLAIVRNAKDMAEVVEVSRLYFQRQVWIGLRHELASWTWSHKVPGSSGATFMKWNQDEPNDYTQGKENCVFARDGFWHDAPCQYEEAFVCSNGSSTLPTFVLMDMKLNWYNAQVFCRNNFTDLASVRNESENDWLKNLTGGRSYWIGLHRAPWRWPDGTYLTFTRWNTLIGEPDQGFHGPCVTVHGGFWEDNDCQQQLVFVCQLVRYMKKVMIRGTTEDLSLNLEDVAGAILQQLNQAVNDLGLTREVKLTWTKQPDGKIFHRDKEEVTESEEITCPVT